MSATAAFAIGAIAGLAIASLLINPSSCCDTLAGAVRSKVGSALGTGAQELGDALGIWKYTPGILDAVGYKP